MPCIDEYGGYELWELRNRNPKFGRHNRPNLYYCIYVDSDSITEEGLAKISLKKTENFNIAVYPKNSEGGESCWRWGEEKLQRDGIDSKPQVVWAKQKRDGGWNIYEKSRKSTTKAKSIWADNAVISEQGTIESGKLDMSGVLEFPKPIELIKRCIKLGTSDGDIVLDFFAGSGTTAHAVMSQNIEDSMKRKWISVQLPEPTYELENGEKIPKKNSNVAYEKGYLNISEVAKERIRRASQDIKEKNSMELEFNSKEFDLGFKAFRLEQSNFSKWHTSMEMDVNSVVKQIEFHVDHVDKLSSQEDILYELLLKSGFKPTKKIKTLELEGKKVFSIADNELLICLEDEITAELINAIVEIQPLQFICLDKAFHGNDQLKANTVQTFAALNQGREKIDRIEFRTV